MSEPFRAIPTRDRSEVLLRRGAWSLLVKASDLRRWLDMYRQLRDRKAPPAVKGQAAKPGPYHDIHGPAVAQIEAAMRLCREAGTV